MARPGRDFEQLIASIVETATPGARVEHDVRVKGRSGIQRQLDVTLTTQVGLNRVFIVFECRDYKRPIDIEKLEAFATKLRDVGASQGVMVSRQGFSSGADAVAREHFIALFTYREAQSADWTAILGEEAWIQLMLTRSTIISLRAILATGEAVPVDLEAQLVSASGEPIMLAGSVVNEVCSKLQMAVRTGVFDLDAHPDHDAHLMSDGRLQKIAHLSAKIEILTEAFSLNMALASGHVISDVSAGEKSIYTEIVTEGFDWKDLIASGTGRRVDAEELQELSRTGAVTLRLPEAELKQWLRLVIRHKNN